jgi:hypothetical protein
MKYDPTSNIHRKTLANSIISKLETCGFSEEESAGERVFSREVRDGMYIKVYTSVFGDTVRAVGKDAVRVSGIYSGDNSRGLFKNRRVNRVGEIDDIVERMYQKMRATWSACDDRPNCKDCGAPTFVSKKKNNVCVNICWDKENKK